MMYSPKVMEHFAAPHNVGVIEDANGVGEVGQLLPYLKVYDSIHCYLDNDDAGKTATKRIIAAFAHERCPEPVDTILTIQNEGKYTQEYLSLTRDFYLFA